MITLDKFEAGLRQDNFLMWLAIKHHRTHKKEFLNFKQYPYQIQIYKDKSNEIDIIKSTQNGISEYALLRAISKAIKGQNIFYVLPRDLNVKRVVDERLTKSIQHTPYYRALIKIVKQEMEFKQTDSMRSQDIGDGNIAFVSSLSTPSFAEYPADEYIIDELDRCDQKNIAMCEDRIANSSHRTRLKISNPTFRNVGIDAEYKKTDMLEWFVECQKGHRVRLDWFKHIVLEIDAGKYAIRDPEWTWNCGRDIYPICDKCQSPINRKGKGMWIQTGSGQIRGYRLTKLFSGRMSLVEILDRFRRGLVNPDVLQRFYNADLGEGFTAKGSRIDIEMIQDCIGDYQPGKDRGLIVAGVDVGKWYHFVIAQLTPEGLTRVILIDKCIDTDEVIKRFREYNVKCAVIDANPETREARKIADSIQVGFLCYFGNVKKDSIDPMARNVTVQRTPAFDAAQEAILTTKIKYPINSMSNKEFVQHMTSNIRAYNPEKKVSGSIGAYEWICDQGEDHWLLSNVYLFIARRLIYLLAGV